jgi:hypothetical protein
VTSIIGIRGKKETIVPDPINTVVLFNNSTPINAF